MTETEDLTPAGGDRDRRRLEILGHLAAGVAHELNNWFFVIRGFSEIARLDVDRDHPVSESLDRIEEAVDVAESLTRMVLECAHPSGEGVIRTRIHPIVKEGVKLLRTALPETVTLQQQVSTEIPMVAIEPVGFFSAVMDLLRATAAPVVPNGGRLWVRLAEIPVDGAVDGGGVRLELGSSWGDKAEHVQQQLEAGDGVCGMPGDSPRIGAAARYIGAAGGELEHRSITGAGGCTTVVLPSAAAAPIG